MSYLRGEHDVLWRCYGIHREHCLTVSPHPPVYPLPAFGHRNWTLLLGSNLAAGKLLPEEEEKGSDVLDEQWNFLWLPT